MTQIYLPTHSNFENNIAFSLSLYPQVNPKFFLSITTGAATISTFLTPQDVRNIQRVMKEQLQELQDACPEDSTQDF